MYIYRLILFTYKSSVLHFSLSVILFLQEESPAKQATLPAKQSAAIIQLSPSPTLQKAKRLRASISTQTSSKKAPCNSVQNFAQNHVKSVNLRWNQHHHTPKVPSRGQFLQKNPLSSALRISESVSSACLSQHNPLQKTSVQLGVKIRPTSCKTLRTLRLNQYHPRPNLKKVKRLCSLCNPRLKVELTK